MKKLFAVSIVVVGLGLVTGCSLKNKGASVANDPPNTKGDLSLFTFGVNSGRLKSQFFSAFFWPENWNKDDYRKNVYEINTASKNLYQTMVRDSYLPSIQIDQKWYDFLEMNCIKRFAVIGDTDDADSPLPNKTWTWKPAPVQPVLPTKPDEPRAVPSTDPGYADYQKKLAQYQKDIEQYKKDLAAYDENLKKFPADSADYPVCVLNQDDRAKLQTKKDLYNTEITKETSPLAVATQAVNKVGDENKVPLDQNSCVLVIEDGKVSIEITNFNKMEIRQSNVADRNMIPAAAIRGVEFERNRLRFTVPYFAKINPWTTVDKNDSSTYQIHEYVFILERVQNLVSHEKRWHDDDGKRWMSKVDMAVFKGEVQLKVDGVVVSKGAAQIVGPLESAAVEIPAATR